MKNIVAAAMLLAVAPAWAQDDTMPPMDHSQMDHSQMNHGAAPQDGAAPVMDHSQMDHSQMNHGAAPQEDQVPAMDHGQMDHTQMDHGTASSSDAHAGHGAMGTMDHGAMQGGKAPPDARDPHAYSGGYDFGPYPLHLADGHRFGALLVDRLEAASTANGSATAYALTAWYGRTYDRAVLISEGEHEGGTLEHGRTELLWSRAIAAYWDTRLGVRFDHGEGPGRSWLAFGVQGLAPYWFELDATVYVGDEGRTALRAEVEYELLLTQRLILQPMLEANFYGKDDAARGLGAGLSDVGAGLRLRYEIRREFAPYVGVAWSGKYGATADYATAAGLPTAQTRWLAGIRFWF
jgi:copper resistance protein B